MENPKVQDSFELALDGFSPYEADVVLNGLSKYSEFVGAVDDELTREELSHSKKVDDNGEVVFHIQAKDIQFFSIEQAWPAIASELGLIALKQDIDPTILIRDPKNIINRTATDIPIIH